jgi:hypothetical protein
MVQADDTVTSVTTVAVGNVTGTALYRWNP